MSRVWGWLVAVPAACLLVGLSVSAEPVAPEALVDRLAHPDARERAEAARELERLGEAARPVLEQATSSPIPAVARRARRLLDRIAIGAHLLSPLADPALVEAALEARSSEEAKARAARDQLAQDPAYAAPLIARLLRDAQAGELPGSPMLTYTAFGRLHHRGPGGALADRPAVIAAMVESEADLEAHVYPWLESSAAAAAEAQRQEISLAAAYAKGEQVADWFTGNPQAELPSPFFENDPIYAALARDLILGLDTVDLDAIDDPVAASLARLLQAMARADADQVSLARLGLLEAMNKADEDADDGLPARLLAVVALGRMDLLEDLATAYDPVEFAGSLWVQGNYSRFEIIAQEQRWARQPRERQRLQQATSGLVRELLQRPRGRGQEEQTDTADGFKQLRLDAYDAVTSADPEAEALLRDLVAVDPAEPAWRLLLAEQVEGDEAMQLRVEAEAMPLTDWRRRLEAAQLVSAYAPGEETEAWVAGQARSAALWALPDPLWSIFALRMASAVAEQTGDWELAARLTAATLATLLRSDVQQALREQVAARRPDLGVLGSALRAMTELERAQMHLAPDDKAAASAYERAIVLTPIDPSVSIDRIQMLDAAGRDREAAAVFVAALNPLAVRAQRYQRSALLFNQTAWLAACAGRRLDTALTLAQSAVNLDSSRAAYLDTLAEVHLARGETETALRLMETVLARADDGELPLYLRRRAEMRERAGVDADQPDE